jgi:hypothetical protein
MPRDSVCFDYLSEGGQPAELSRVAFERGEDGSPHVQHTSSVGVTDSASAWDVLVQGLSKMRSYHHQILTITIRVPLPDAQQRLGGCCCVAVLLCCCVCVCVCWGGGYGWYTGP